MADESDEQQETGPKLAVYEGDRDANGARHGKGKTTFPNGDMYIGEYVNGLKQGKGVYRWKNGAIYSGDYVANAREGRGTFVYPDGSRYKGDFVRGRRQGNGTYLFANADSYSGEWAEDLRHGNGTYIYGGSGVKRIGVWEKGVFKGAGELVYQDHSLSGTFSAEKSMSGLVKLTFGKDHDISVPAQFAFAPAIKSEEEEK
ncbi:hypothetical protein M427DRAFT_109636 [Gonapodya prolifera JEL478]|uniref:Histone H3 K4-specific methyltransferase SET7/9 N-terminal domain-containing protein n=1 Tax=Gonapodya prolifera (strain JEL478) TaxID=1344416 RepID=A0A139ANX8_GONPJ|nr:hypothetical protein M427DRAFT_109636 [Gonapodya prolifera JEL478]|eukprot:KXS18461.1 hypothetical protein M427DRAFT_109636 [Gonapodya prolifera JEL478]